MHKAQKTKKEKQIIVKIRQIEYIKNVICKCTYVPKGKVRNEQFIYGH